MGNPDCSCKLTRPVPSASGRRRRRRGSGWVSAGWRRPGRCGVRLLGQYAPALRPLTAAATVPMDSPCCSCKPTPRSGPISGHVSGVTAVGGRRPAAPLRSTPQQHAHTCPAAAPRGKAGFSSSKTLPFAQRDRAQRRRCVPVQVALGGIEESMQQLVAESQVWLTAAVPMENPYCSCMSHGLQLQSLWRIPTAAVSQHLFTQGLRTELRAAQGAVGLGEDAAPEDWAGGGGAAQVPYSCNIPIEYPYCSCELNDTTRRRRRRTSSECTQATGAPSSRTASAT